MEGRKGRKEGREGGKEQAVGRMLKNSVQVCNLLKPHMAVKELFF